MRQLAATEAEIAADQGASADELAHAMRSRRPDLTAGVHLVAGLNGAGKTTLARRLEKTLPAVRISLDELMLRLYQVPFDHPTYPELSARARELIWDLSAQMLATGSSVILDWNMWNRALRADAVQRCAELGATCHVHHVDVPLDVATQRSSNRDDPHTHELAAADVRHLARSSDPTTARASSCTSSTSMDAHVLHPTTDERPSSDSRSPVR